MANYDGDITLRVDLEPGDITSTAKDLQSRVRELSKLDFGKNLSKTFSKTLDNMKKSSDQADKLLDKIKKLETVRPTNIYTNLEKELDSLTEKQRDLMDQIRRTDIQRGLAQGQGDTGRFVTLSTELINYRKELDGVNSKITEVTSSMEAMEAAGTDVFSETNKAEYSEYLSALSGVNDELTRYVNIAENAAESSTFTPDTATSKWQSFMAVLSQTHPMLARIGSAAGEAFQRVADNVQFTASHIRQSLINVLQSIPQLAARAAVGLAKLAGRGLIAGIKLVAKSALSAAKNLAKMAANAVKAVGRNIINGFKRLASAIGKTNKASSNANGTFKKGFLFILRYALGIRSIYFLFRRLRKALGEGIGNLAQYSSPFNQVISNFISALTRLKNTFATAFAPIINVVLPIITTFINAISAAVTKVGMLIAALTGKKTFIAAKAVQEDFAGSMDGAADAANGANEAAKEYQRTISGFDDVEILKNPDNNGSPGGGGNGGGGGGGGIDPADMFETVELPAGYYDLAQMIKDSWANADFTDLGALLGQKIAEALYNIPWDTIQKFAGNFGKSFATFINGLISVPELATAIGYTIGQALNTLFVLANAFVTNLEWDKIGKFFADVMNEGIKTIKWDLIVDTLATAANGIFNALNTWATTFDFGALATAISNTVRDTLNGLNWENIKAAVSNLGAGLAEFVNNLIKPSTFSSIGTTIAEAINTAIAGIKSFAINTDWPNLGQSIAAGLSSFFTKLNLKDAGFTLGTFANGLLDAVTTAVTDPSIDWKSVGNKIIEGIRAFFDTFEVSKVAGLLFALMEAGAAILEGLLEGIVDWFKNNPITNWIRTNVFDPFVNGIKSIFGIASPSKEMKPLGQNIIEGVFQGILDWLGSVKEWIKNNIFDKFKKAWTDLGGIAGIIGGAVDVTVNFIKKAGQTLGGIIGTATDATVNFLKKAGQTLSGIIGDATDAVVTFAKKTGQTLSGLIGSTTDAVVTFAKKKGQDLADLIGNAMNATVTFAKKSGQTLSGLIGNSLGATVTFVKKSGQTLAGLIGTASHAIVTFAKKRGQTLAGLIGSKMTAFISLAKSGWSSLKTWLTGTTKGIVSVGISLFKSGWSSLKSFFGFSSGGIIGANGSVKAFADGGVIKSYGTGGAPSHGTVFVAGENGTEAVSHINGRTEVMNQFQMATVMYSSVIAAVAPVINYMKECTNTIIANIGSELNYLKFMSGQLYTINTLGNTLSTNVGNIVTGKVVPNNFNSNDLNNLNQTLDKLSSMLYDTHSNAVTRDELTSILTTMFTRYMNFSCYIGDEDIARHANNGNARLEMRFSPVAR